MNMHSTNLTVITAAAATIGRRSGMCALDLMRASLELLDHIQVPGEIGAHLDHSIDLLHSHLSDGKVVAPV